MNHPQKFSFAYYKHLLSQMKDRGFQVSSFANYNPLNKKTVIMRHDVDYTLHGAIDFGRIEAELGVTSTYLFRVHADEYNIFSCTTFRVISELKKLGHEIGLHFESMNIGRALDLDPMNLLLRAKTIIEAVLEQPVQTCSEHRDFSNIVHETPKFESLFDPYSAGFKFFAMDPKYTKDMKYLSESNANWREGDPLVHLDQHNRFQILVHPDWWFDSDFLLKGPYVHSRREQL